MELYFPSGRTDLVLFPLEHITHQESLDKMLKDRDEVAVLSAVLSCLMRNATRAGSEEGRLFSQARIQLLLDILYTVYMRRT